MKVLCMGLLAGVLATGLHAEENVRAHVETSFDVTVHAPAAEAEKLFTPEGERVWAGKHWDPQYVYASGPEKDGVGAVFTIQHGPVQAVWVVTARDVEARHFQYAYTMAGLLVTTIDVRFSPMDAETTQVHVTYARTAVSADGDEHVKTLSEGDGRAGAAWQKGIDSYLAGKKRG